MSEAAPPPRRQSKAMRTQQLLEAALSLFVEKGFAATRAEEVAQLAGVSKGTLYLYYPSKEELLKAVIREHLSARIAAVAAAIEIHRGPVAEVLRQVYCCWWIDAFEGPTSGVFKLIVTEVRNFPEIAEFYAAEVIEPAERLIASIVQRGIDSGEFEPLHMPSVVHSLTLPMVMMCVHKHSLAVCLGPDVLDAHSFVPAHADLVIRGLRRTAAAGVGAAAAAATPTAGTAAPKAAPKAADKPARAPARRTKTAS